MPTKSPLITIGLITYNAAASLPKVISSALKQTYPNIEIVVVDDVSTDKTWKMLQALANEHKNIRVFQNKQNGGAGLSRNRLVDEANGEFIAFFDDDDLSLPERVEKQYQRITSYEKAHKLNTPVICHTSRQVTDENGRQWTVKAMGCVKENPPSGLDITDNILFGKKIMHGHGSIGTGMQMARTKAYRDANNFDTKFRRCQDTELAIRWGMMGAHFVGIKENLMLQNISIGKKKLDLEKKYTLLSIDKHRKYLEEKGLYKFARTWTEAKYAFWAGQRGKFLSLMTKAFFMHPITFGKRAVEAFPSFGYNLMLKKKYKKQKSKKCQKSAS